jgi:hypothetical protein
VLKALLRRWQAHAQAQVEAVILHTLFNFEVIFPNSSGSLPTHANTNIKMGWPFFGTKDALGQGSDLKQGGTPMNSTCDQFTHIGTGTPRNASHCLCNLVGLGATSVSPELRKESKTKQTSVLTPTHPHRHPPCRQIVRISFRPHP